MGKKAGEKAYVEVREGFGYYVTVKSIDKSTDDSDDKIRRY